MFCIPEPSHFFFVDELASHFTENIREHLKISFYVRTYSHSFFLFHRRMTLFSATRVNPLSGLTAPCCPTSSKLCSIHQLLPVSSGISILSVSSCVQVSCTLNKMYPLSKLPHNVKLIFLSFSLPHAFLKAQPKFSTSTLT